MTRLAGQTSKGMAEKCVRLACRYMCTRTPAAVAAARVQMYYDTDPPEVREEQKGIWVRAAAARALLSFWHSICGVATSHRSEAGTVLSWTSAIVRAYATEAVLDCGLLLQTASPCSCLSVIQLVWVLPLYMDC